MEREYPVPGYEGYFATESGDIVSYKRGRRKVLKQQSKYNLGQRVDLMVHLHNNGKGKKIRVHRAVLSAKLGRELHILEQSRHINGNSRDNRMSNLRPGSKIQNIFDELVNGRRSWEIQEMKFLIERLEVEIEDRNDLIKQAWALMSERLQKTNSGEEGIRTPGAREDTPVFKTGAINHSTTSPESLYEPLPTFS